MIKIKNPELRIIESAPSNLNTKDFYIIIYEKGVLNDSTDPFYLYEIAEEIHETAEYNGCILLHESSDKGARIRPLDANENKFSFNRTNCDSILVYHTIAYQVIGESIRIRTGFIELHPTEVFSDFIHDWDTIASHAHWYQEIETDKTLFFERYQEQIELWNARYKDLSET